MTTPASGRQISRRSVAKGTVWAAPAVLVATTAPALAASPVTSLCTAVTPDSRFTTIGDGPHSGKTAVSLVGGVPMEPIYLDVNNQDGDAVKDARINISGSLPEGVTLSKAADGRWMLSGTPKTPDLADLDRSELGTEVKFTATSPSHPTAVDGCTPSLVFYVGGWDLNMNTAGMTFGYAGTEFYVNLINEGVVPTPAGMVFAVSFNCRNVSSFATGRVVLTSALPYNVEVLDYSDGNKLQGLPSTGLPTGEIVSIYLRVNNSIEPGGVLGFNVATMGVAWGNRLDVAVKWMNPQPSSQYEWPGRGGRYGFWTDEQNAGWREKDNKIFFHSQGGATGIDGFAVYDVQYAIRSRAEVPADDKKVLFHSNVAEWPNP